MGSSLGVQKEFGNTLFSPLEIIGGYISRPQICIKCSCSCIPSRACAREALHEHKTSTFSLHAREHIHEHAHETFHEHKNEKAKIEETIT